MKKYFGFFVAAGALLLTWAMTALAKRYGDILDAFYPYVTRWGQKILAGISSIFPFTLWQALAVLLVLLLFGSLGLVIWKKRSLVRWLGWVLAVVSLGWCAHVGIYGLNFHASALSQDIRMEKVDLTQADLENALIFFRDQANDLAEKLPRDENENLLYDHFNVLAEKAGMGYKNLTKEGYSVFAGSVLPPKKLAWAWLYNSMGICGVSMALTGEASVNPDIPNMSIPYVMCHEMAHRMCIALEDDANFAAFLACEANEDLQFQYSAYYMAYRYCYNALAKADRAALQEIHNGVRDLFRRDLKFYDAFFAREQKPAATTVANTANNAYIQASGDKNGTASYGMVATQLVTWYLQETRPEENEVPKFDPTDKDYISGIIGDKHE